MNIFNVTNNNFHIYDITVSLSIRFNAGVNLISSPVGYGYQNMLAALPFPLPPPPPHFIFVT